MEIAIIIRGLIQNFYYESGWLAMAHHLLFYVLHTKDRVEVGGHWPVVHFTLSPPPPKPPPPNQSLGLFVYNPVA